MSCVERKCIISTVVTHYEKRTNPSKHYVFAILVTWSDEERLQIYRRYSDFFSFHEMLPESVKTVLSLPERIFFGRSNISRVAEARLDAINKYCQILMQMHPSISQTPRIWKFFSCHTGDKILPKITYDTPSLHPQGAPGGNMLMEEHHALGNFNAENKTELSIETGDLVMVLAKDPSGWFMCQKGGRTGWVPGSYLMASSSLRSFDQSEVLGFVGSMESPLGDQNVLQVEVEGEAYKATDTYEAQGLGQVSFKAGDVITVLEKVEDGWWFVRKEQAEGWAPSSYLESLSGVGDQNSIPNQGEVRTAYIATEEYTAEDEDELTFPRNAVITVTQRSLDGWWQATYNGHTGLVPSSHLVPFGEQLDIVQVPEDSLVLKQSYKQPPKRPSVVRKSKILEAIPAGDPGDSMGSMTIDLISFESIKKSPEVSTQEINLDANRLRARTQLVQPLDTISPSPNQFRTRSPSPHHRPAQDKGLITDATDVDPNTLNVSATLSNQTGSPLLRRREMERSKSCQDQAPSIGCILGSNLSNTCPQHNRTAVVNKQTSVQSAYQDADCVPRYSSLVHHIPIPPLSTLHDLKPPLPQTSPTHVVTETGVDPGVNVQQMAEMMVRFILASNNPELRAALKRVIESDPSIARQL